MFWVVSFFQYTPTFQLFGIQFRKTNNKKKIVAKNKSWYRLDLYGTGFNFFFFCTVTCSVAVEWLQREKASCSSLVIAVLMCRWDFRSIIYHCINASILCGLHKSVCGISLPSVLHYPLSFSCSLSHSLCRLTYAGRTAAGAVLYMSRLFHKANQ